MKVNLSRRVATAAVLIVVGLILSFLNPFAYFPIFGTQIFPFAHFINAISGVLIGIAFSTLTAFGIALLRFPLRLGSPHAFHGGISGAIVVGLVAHLLRMKKPKYVRFAAITEPLGTVFIGGTIAQLVIPLGTFLEGLFFYWGLFAASCIPGCILGFLMLLILKKAGITWKDYF